MCNILNVMSNNITLQLCQIVFAVGISTYLYILTVHLYICEFIFIILLLSIFFYCTVLLYNLAQ